MSRPSYILKERYRKSIVNFLKGMSKRDAMTEAGYSTITPVKDIFDKPEVIDEINRRQKSMSTKALVDADWVIRKLKAIAGADIADLMVLDAEGLPRTDMSKMTPELRIALTGYKVDGQNITLKNADKLKALEMLARYLGLFDDKLQVQGELSLIDRLQAGRNRTGNDSLENVT